MFFLNSRFAKSVLLILCLIPLFLLAYLGSHSRMMADDYCHVQLASDYGLLPSLAYSRSNWNGSYTSHLIFGLLAPLGKTAPTIFPALTIAVWLVASAALIFQVLTIIQLCKFPGLTAVAAAAVVIAFSINAFFSPQSLYYYAATARHTLPIAGITAYFALFAAVCRQRNTARSRAQQMAIAGGAICFMNAGIVETVAIFQLLCLGIICLASVFFMERPANRRCGLFLFVGILATAASIIVMATAPGTAIRKSMLDSVTSQQARNFVSLAAMSLETGLLHLRDPELIKGFIAVYALGLHLTLERHRAAPMEQTLPPNVGLARGPLLIALALQILCLIMLLEHVSDDPYVLGRYSIGYSIVLLANLVLVISIALLLLFRARASRSRLGHRGNSTSLGALLLLAVLLATALAQIRGVDWRVSTYCYLTLLGLLLSLSWQWSYSLPRQVSRPAWIAIITAYAVSIGGSLLIVFFGYYIGGYIWLRILTFVPYAFFVSGLIWASYLGYAIICLCQDSRAAAAVTLVLKVGSLIVLLIIGAGAFIEQARLVPSLQQYAVEWAAREQQIIDDRERGLRTVTVAPLSFELESYIGIDKLHKGPCPLRYYDVDAIQLEGQ